MRRPNGQHQPEGHERWLVSYADFITLLFAFFVVLYASSQADRQKTMKAAESVRRAFDGEPKVAHVIGGTIDDVGQGNAMKRGPGGTKTGTALQEPSDLGATVDLLKRSLADDIQAGRINIHTEARGLVVSLEEAAYFVSGDDKVSSAGFPVLEKIAATLVTIPNPIRLEGHTDAVPIHNSRFHSNWELSAARSIAMLEALSTRFSIETNRMSVVGYADAFPLDTNDTPEGRAKNRRVDIVILNKAGLISLPNTIPQNP
jgi:chemotaxis protein MotB